MSTPQASPEDRTAFKAIPDDFNMSAEPQVFGPFSLTFPTGARQFMLREPTEAAHIAYKNASMRGMTIKAAGEKDDSPMSATMASGAEADTVLVAHCLFEVTQVGPLDPNSPTQPMERPMGYDFVKNLPRRITARLYAKVRALGGMDEDQETPDFLRNRIKSDTSKLARIEKDGTPGNGE